MMPGNSYSEYGDRACSNHGAARLASLAAVPSSVQQSAGAGLSPHTSLQREYARYQLQQLQQQPDSSPKASPGPPQQIEAGNYWSGSSGLYTTYKKNVNGRGVNTVPGPSSALQAHYLEQRIEHPSLRQGRILLGFNVSPNMTTGSSSHSNQALLSFQTGCVAGTSFEESSLLLRLQSQQQQQRQHQTYLQGFDSPSLAALAAAQQQVKLNQQYNSLLGDGGHALLNAKTSNNNGITTAKAPLGGSIEPFPEKLHRLLTEVEATGRSDVISWASQGRTFVIHKAERFFRDIVPLYFRQSHLSSFKRQLNLYGFELITDKSRGGDTRGGYRHELFVRDKPELCRKMRRVSSSQNNSRSKTASAKDVMTKQIESSCAETEV